MLAWDISHWADRWRYPCGTFPKEDTSTSERENCWRTEKDGKAWSYCTPRIEEPTEWVKSLVVVQKPNGSVRLCIDPRDLNAATKRSYYPMKTVDDERLMKFLERASKKGLKLNKEKCKIRQREVPYVGHLLTAEGLRIDPQKVKAIHEMPEPKTKEDVKRLLGFVQFLSRYLPRLSTVDAPLRELDKSDVLFHWDYPQMESFRKIKQLVSQAPVLQYYDVDKPVTIQCDASGTGLGVVLLQDKKPVCYASRALTDIETRYDPNWNWNFSSCFRLSQVSSVHLWQKCHGRDRS